MINAAEIDVFDYQKGLGLFVLFSDGFCFTIPDDNEVKEAGDKLGINIETLDRYRCAKLLRKILN